MSNAPTALTKALEKLLKPLARLLLRHGMAYGEFADLVKQAFVEVANDDFAVPGRKQSLTRVSVLTGIHRREVGKLLRNERSKASYAPNHTRAARVISGWLNDPDFSSNGKAKDLNLNEEFGSLIARHGGDVTTRAMLDELERVGAIERSSEDTVRLLVKAFTPQDSIEDLVHIFGDSTADLLETLDHNLGADESNRRLQISVVYNNLPDDVLQNLELVSRDRAMTFLNDLNSFYATQDRSTNPGVEGKGRNRAGIGLYYFQHPIEDEDSA